MPPQLPKLRLICISDTHNHHPSLRLPLPDPSNNNNNNNNITTILLHAGDLTNNGTLPELTQTLHWLAAQPHFCRKLFIAGNHDTCLAEQPRSEEVQELLAWARERGVLYLEHEGVEFEVFGVRVRVFGSPCSPLGQEGAGKFAAFQYEVLEAEGVWKAFAAEGEVDLLITHTPPRGFCDASAHWVEGGCEELARVVGRVRPRVVVCGHCHEGRGAVVVRWGVEGRGEVVRRWEDPGKGSRKLSLFDLTGRKGDSALRAGEETAVVNASVVANSHGSGPMELNKPIVVDVDLPLREAEGGRGSLGLLV